MKYIMLVVLLLSSIMLTGCIPPNEHVGKPAPHTYHHNNYYGNGYYYYR